MGEPTEDYVQFCKGLTEPDLGYGAALLANSVEKLAKEVNDLRVMLKDRLDRLRPSDS
jgi:hypothetical protein